MSEVTRPTLVMREGTQLLIPPLVAIWESDLAQPGLDLFHLLKYATSTQRPIRAFQAQTFLLYGKFAVCGSPCCIKQAKRGAKQNGYMIQDAFVIKILSQVYLALSLTTVGLALEVTFIELYLTNLTLDFGQTSF